MNILDLDKYLIIHIFSFLKNGEIFILNETSKTLKSLIDYDKGLRSRIKIPHPYDIVQSIKLILWAKSHSSFKYDSRYSQFGSKQNSLRVIKFLFYDKCKFNKYAYIEAIYNRNFKIIKWLYEHDIELTEDVFAAAAEVGNLKLLKWLKQKNCPWDEQTINASARSGNLRALKFAIKNGCDWEIQAFNYACQSGNIKIMEYLFKEACNDLSKPWWNSTVCASAAQYGQLCILQFLKEKGCPWDVLCTYNAFYHNHIDVLVWAIQNKCPIYEGLFNLLVGYGLKIERNRVNIV